MKTIPEAFRKNGYDYELVCRNEHAAIYRQFRLHDGDDRTTAFEVMLIGRRSASSTDMGGRTVYFEESEVLPGNEQWGLRGWTFVTLEAARAKFNEIGPTFRLREATTAIPANN